jgi:hypothetical protein
LVCVTVLGAAAFWMWHLNAVSCSGGFPPFPGWWFFLVILFALAAGAGFILALADRLALVMNGHGVLNRHFWIAILTALLMAVPAVCCARGLWELVRELVGRPPYYAQLLLARTLSVGSWVSQAPFVLFMSAALYVWAFWHARQLAMNGESYASSGLLHLLCGESRTTPSGGSREMSASELAAVLASPWRRTRLRLLSAAVLAAFLYGILTWNAGYGIDGLAFSRFFWWATLLVVFLFAHSVSQTAHLVLMLGRALNALGAHPMAPAFQRIANRRLFNWSLSTGVTRAYRLLPILGVAQSLSNQIAAKRRWEFGALADATKPTNLQAAAASPQTEPDCPFLRSRAWTILATVGDRGRGTLDDHFWHKPAPDSAKPLHETAEELRSNDWRPAPESYTIRGFRVSAQVVWKMDPATIFPGAGGSAALWAAAIGCAWSAGRASWLRPRRIASFASSTGDWSGPGTGPAPIPSPTTARTRRRCFRASATPPSRTARVSSAIANRRISGSAEACFNSPPRCALPAPKTTSYTPSGFRRAGRGAGLCWSCRTGTPKSTSTWHWGALWAPWEFPPCA